MLQYSVYELANACYRVLQGELIIEVEFRFERVYQAVDQQVQQSSFSQYFLSVFNGETFTLERVLKCVEVQINQPVNYSFQQFKHRYEERKIQGVHFLLAQV